MGMVVQHNMNAINAYNRLNANVAGLKKASEKLSSGYRINRAGDDAAGLAISEKMRSQIKGLNQAVRNSQDGINMIQTFEGAAQETHSILQRMKELAVESANGTYDNATDRAAIQLEFEQLNDELNQIADTDFNGTIVLNGGEMADGLKVTDKGNGMGEFNYADATAAAKAFADGKDVATAIAADVLHAGNNADDVASNIIRNSTYGGDEAAALWEKLGLDVNETDDIDVTFVYQDGEWKASAIMGKTMTDPGKAETTTTTYSGSVQWAGNPVDVSAKIPANYNGTDDLWYDGTDVTAGANPGGGAAQVTVTANTTGNGDGVDPTYEMTNITDKVDLSKLTVTPATGEDATGNGGFTVSWGDGDNSVNAVFDAYAAKNGDHLTINFKNTPEKTFAPNNIDTLEDSVSTDDDTISVDDIDIAVKLDAGVTDDKMDKLMKEALDELKTLEFSFDGTDITATGTVKLTVDTDGMITYQGADGTDINLAKVEKPTIEGGATLTTGKKIDFKLKVADYNVADLTKIKANSVETSDAAWEAVKAGDTSGVTKADAFDNSTAIMSYAEHIVLQTGARTKDAVDFTFSYNRDGTADMGTLKANLNLSAREGGLETENLSLANQKDANHAIDQIDKAINKTSMVRATFGAIQNRLEHKITNLTTTSENLTEAESSIRDTDMASEMMNYTKFNILQQAAQSMLAQANQQPQSILQLLG